MDKIKDLLKNVRSDYRAEVFDISTALNNPFEQFEQWFAQAVASNIPDVNAMNLATADLKGRPSSRIVLLRDASEQGFTFFTNYHSRKGKNLNENPYAALNFFWPSLEKQIRIEGKVTKVDESISDAYFASRPHDSQIGAWASDQSSEIASRLVLEEKFLALKEQMGNSVLRPKHWGGYLLKPDYFEFWQGRENRLHDRIAYFKNDMQLWNKKILSP